MAPLLNFYFTYRENLIPKTHAATNETFNYSDLISVTTCYQPTNSQRPSPGVNARQKHKNWNPQEGQEKRDEKMHFVLMDQRSMTEY